MALLRIFSFCISHNMRCNWLHMEQWSGLLCSMLCVCLAPPPLLHHLPLPAFYRVSGLHFAVSPLPVHRKLASSDPHQTSCKEVGPWKTSPQRRGGEKSGEGGPFLMGVVPSGGLTALASCPHPPSSWPHLPRRPASAQHSPIFLRTSFVFATASMIWQVFYMHHVTPMIWQWFYPFAVKKLNPLNSTIRLWKSDKLSKNK